MLTNCRLVAVDMDGTFLTDKKEYDRQHFAELYKKMQARNIQFVVASGNQYYQLESFFSEYPETIYIADNGANIRKKNAKYFGSHFVREKADQILRLLEYYKGLNDELVVSGFSSAYILPNRNEKFMQAARFYNRHLQIVDSFSEIKEEITKYSFNYYPKRDGEFMWHMQGRLAGLGEITTSGHGNFDIIQPGVHKASGLKYLSQKLNIPLNQMCAFGDGGNDLEMLRAVGDGVAMSNAAPEVKRVADHLTGTNNDQGVLRYIERLVN